MPRLPRKSSLQVSLPEKHHLQVVADRLISEVQKSLNPRLPSEAIFRSIARRRVYSLHFSYYRQGVAETIRVLKKRGFIPILNDEEDGKPAWVCIQKKFEYAGLRFKAEINCAPRIPRAQLRISVEAV